MMLSSIWRIYINIMKIVKLLKDYSKTPQQANLSKYLSQELESTICFEPIKNKKFMIKYIQPLNDFVIYTTAFPCADARRVIL